MTRLFFFFCSFLCVITIDVMAESGASSQIDISDIEAQERQQIIKELSWHLNTKKVCGLNLMWDDSGSGANKDGYFFIPPESKNEYMIGGYGSEKLVSDYHCVLMVSEPADNPKGTPPLLVAPADWQMIWKDSGSGANKDGSMWQAFPPDNNYRCIGSVPQNGYNKPNLPGYRCVHDSLTKKISATTLLWSDKGSGADKPVSIFRLPNTISMVAVAARTDKVEAYDLIDNATSKPDPKKVEAILAERMASLKSQIEEQTKARIAEKEQEKKKLAEAAEKKRLAEEAEKEKLAVQAEQKAAEKEAALKKKTEVQAAAAEEKQLKQDAEKKRLAEAAEKKRLAEEAEKKRLAEETEKKKAAEAMAQQEKVTVEKTEQPVVTEVAKPEPVEPRTVSVDKTEEPGSKASKGLDDLVFHFVKYILYLFGALIVLMIVFKLLFGSKSRKE